MVNTALMMGHKAISVENVYTHAYRKEEQKQIPDELKGMSPAEIKEMYEMYQKLRGIFDK